MSAPTPSAAIPSSLDPLTGLWRPLNPQQLYYGPSGTVSKFLLKCLPSPTSKAFIVTGTSLATKTPLIKQVEELLGPTHHAGTFSKIGQHAPIKDLDAATEMVKKDPTIDSIISIGGGSPIDTAKNISYRLHEQGGKFLFHIAIPTTLSAAEASWYGGYTKSDGLKGLSMDPEICPKVVIFDAGFPKYTPQNLWLSTGIRALDHAVELMYHPSSTEMPCRVMCLASAATLFEYLPRSRTDPDNEDTITRLQLAAYASLAFLGLNMLGGLGLSHALGYSLGSPYGIGHGTTSCLTLGKVVKLKAQLSEQDAKQIARLLPFITGNQEVSKGNDLDAAIRVGTLIEELVEKLGLRTTLTAYGVSTDQASVVATTATGAMAAAAGGRDTGTLTAKAEELVRSLY